MADEGNWHPPPKTGLERVTCNARLQFVSPVFWVVAQTRHVPRRGGWPASDPPFRKTRPPSCPPFFTSYTAGHTCIQRCSFALFLIPRYA
jgi:hypothetical protein